MDHAGASDNAASSIGASMRRWEDPRLLRGLGRFVDDMRVPGQTHMAVLRSPFAHARILGIDAQAARLAPGVLAVLTGADLAADGIGPLRTSVQRKLPGGAPMPEPPYHVLAMDAVRFVGDAVAIIVAETPAQAQDALELVDVAYAPLPSVADAALALEPGAAAVWPELAPDNLCFAFDLGDKDAVNAAFGRAAHVSTLDFRVSRVSANSMETRNAIGLYDPAEERYTLHSGVQVPHKIRSEIAEKSLRIPHSRLRVNSPDMGGGFGMKGSPYPEYVLVLWAARRVGRPVRWIAGRGESFLSDFHARDNHGRVELALSVDGMFQALRVRTIANLGAYLGFNTPHSSTNNLGGLAGTYRTPAIHTEVLGAFTNTQPTAPYRGAGRPEATYALERVIDIAAAELGIDRVDIRRRNLIAPAQMPFKTGLVFTYDCGEFERGMDLALDAGDWHGFPARLAESRSRGKLRGIGIVNAIEIAAGPFRNPNEEGAEIRFDPGGDATILAGSHNHGQGHETVFRQIAHSMLGVDPARVRVVCGDTDMVMHGRGTFGSRSVIGVGAAMTRATERIVARGSIIAAHMLEAAVGDIAFERGVFRIAGTDRSVRIEEVARASFEVARMPKGSELGLGAHSVVAAEEASFPNGCHVCEVEVDPETGVVDVVRYTVSDDVGTVINPMLVKGQVHGGVAQGLGQVLLEQIAYDESGQMLTGSFMDYAMPRADNLPDMKVVANPVPTKGNPLGAKGAGEAGAVGALPVVMNAILDALRPLGVRDLDMPATPERVWAAIQAATVQ